MLPIITLPPSRDILATLRARRLEAGITQEQLAAAMRARGHEWTRSRVSEKESGARPTKLGELDSWVDALEELIGGRRKDNIRR